MTKKKLETGILFCGGCNPYFDRTKIYKEIVGHFNQRMDFSLYSKEKSYDYVFLINGCQSECLMKEVYNGKLFVINNLNYENAISEIEAIIKQGD